MALTAKNNDDLLESIYQGGHKDMKNVDAKAKWKGALQLTYTVANENL